MTTCTQCPLRDGRRDWCPVRAETRKGREPMCPWAVRSRLWERQDVKPAPWVKVQED